MGQETALLLLPGMMCDARLWRHQLRALSGLTLSVGDIGGCDTIDGIARQVLAEAPARFALAGLSMGGIVAFEIWRQAPERVQCLALLDTNFRAEAPARQAMRDEQIRRVTAGELKAVLRDELKPNYLAAAHRSNAALLDEVLAMGLDLGSEVFARQSLALRNRPDSSATLATIGCPVLVLCGEEDSVCPVALHQEMASRIPHAELRIIENCGHLAPMEQPDAVNDAMARWLNQA